MAGTIVTDRIESDASYASSITVASPMVVSNTISMTNGNITGNVNFDSGLLVVNETNNRVGVGTNSPSCKFDLHGPSQDLQGVLSINAISTVSSTFNWASQAFAPTMANNSAFINMCGKEGSTGNAGYWGFRHTGTSGSNSNHSTFGTFGKDSSLNIYHGGWVTMPYQPAFYAMKNNGNINSTAAIVFEDVYVNIGSHYNPANGRFTAPVAGTYHFSANFLKRSGSGRLLFHKNDVYYGSGNSQAFTSVNETMLAASIIITLAAGDYINVIASIDAGDMYGDTNSHNGFSGFLIG
jgi:hypothetical protein